MADHANHTAHATPATHTNREIRIRGLVKEYKKGVPVLKGIDLDIPGDGITAIIGPSGTGKSTLIRCINRLIDPTAGEILFQGQDLAKLSGVQLREARRRIGMVFQEYNLVERLTVMENVLTGRLGYVSAFDAWLRRFPKADIEEAFNLLDSVGLGNFVNQRADGLSGGQRQRVGIARAIMQRPEILLADEPTSSLDPKTSVEIMEIMAEMAGKRNIPVIVNIHNVALAKRFCQRMIGMTGGNVVFNGRPDELTEANLKEIYGGEDWLE
jgi:phosphonate transport system ATP-binding protein